MAAAMIGDEDIELGARSQNGPTTASAAAAAVEPGSYVTQMRAAHNPVRFEPVTKRALAEDGRRDGGHQPPSSTRGIPTHYGIEGEPECCLCTKVGRFIIFLVVVTVIVLGVVYMYWDDIYKTPEGSKLCGVQLPPGVELTPPKALLVNGEMDWTAICGKDPDRIIVLRRRLGSRLPAKHSHDHGEEDCDGFGDRTASFWMGSKFIHDLVDATGGTWRLRIDMKFQKFEFYAEYSDFKAAKTGSKYALCSSTTKSSGNLYEQLEKLSTDDLKKIFYGDEDEFRQSAEKVKASLGSRMVEASKKIGGTTWEALAKHFVRPVKSIKTKREAVFEDTYKFARSTRNSSVNNASSLSSMSSFNGDEFHQDDDPDTFEAKQAEASGFLSDTGDGTAEFYHGIVYEAPFDSFENETAAVADAAAPADAAADNDDANRDEGGDVNKEKDFPVGDKVDGKETDPAFMRAELSRCLNEKNLLMNAFFDCFQCGTLELCPSEASFSLVKTQ